MTRTRWPISALASFVMVGAVTLASPGSASAATWPVIPAQAWVVPDSGTDAWGIFVNADAYGSAGITTEVSHLSGGTWSFSTPPGIDQFAVVAGDSPTDAWAVWGGTAAHYDGSSWTEYSIPLGDAQTNSVAIVSPANVWAAGPRTGMILQHWDGTKWSQVTAPTPAGYTYAGVAADGLSASGGDLWVLASATVGPNNDTEYFVARWDGTSWSLTPALPAALGQQPTNISAASATDVWVGGNDSTGNNFAMHYNGSAWSTFRMPAATGQSDRMAWIAARGDEAWAAGTSQGSGTYPYAALWHWDGSTWSSGAFPVSGAVGLSTVSYVPGSNTVWVEANDPSGGGRLDIAAGG
jgi:hypothetical protein